MRTEVTYTINTGKIMILVSLVMIVLMLLDLPWWWAFIPVGVVFLPFAIGISIFVLRATFAPKRRPGGRRLVR